MQGQRIGLIWVELTPMYCTPSVFAALRFRQGRELLASHSRTGLSRVVLPTMLAFIKSLLIGETSLHKSMILLIHSVSKPANRNNLETWNRACPACPDSRATDWLGTCTNFQAWNPKTRKQSLVAHGVVYRLATHGAMVVVVGHTAGSLNCLGFLKVPLVICATGFRL